MRTEHTIIGMISSVKNYQFNHSLIKNVDDKFFYVVHKQKPFLKFGLFFLNGSNEYGESINEKGLEIAKEHSATLVFIYPLSIYTITAVQFDEWAKAHNTRRIQEESLETTWSAPLSIMRKYKREYNI